MPFPRRPIRLSHPDYLGCRLYFITFCCLQRKQVFLDHNLCSRFLSDLRAESPRQAFAVPAYCLMPDHVHLLVQGLQPSCDLSWFVNAVKQASGFHIKQQTCFPVWQRFFYDHILRSQESSEAVAWYIWMNPVRAGICVDFRDYPYSGSLTSLWPPGRAPSAPWSPPTAFAVAT
jgi:putative transposase